MYLLDTNVVSELRRSKPHGAVLAWLQGVDDKDLYISAVTIGEIQAGIELTREQDGEKAAQIELWLDQVATEASWIASTPCCSSRPRCMRTPCWSTGPSA